VTVAALLNLRRLPTNRGGKPKSLTVLRLKLALAEKQAMWEKEKDQRASEARERQWEIEKKRLEIQSRVNASVVSRGAKPEVHHVLPKINGDDDVLTFFYTFERAMQLNCVEKADWPRYFPAQYQG